MYASMTGGWTSKGLARGLLLDGVPMADLLTPAMKLKPKRELVDMHNAREFQREQAVFHQHMAWVSAGGTARATA